MRGGGTGPQLRQERHRYREARHFSILRQPQRGAIERGTCWTGASYGPVKRRERGRKRR